MNLFTFTTTVRNSGEQPVKMAGGDTWSGPIRPEYVVGDGEENQWRVVPPHVIRTGRGINHVPLPLFIELKSGEEKIVHRSTFVVPVAPGKWKAYAWLRPTMDLRDEGKHKKAEVEGLWMNSPLVSGVVMLTIEREQEKSPQPDAPADADKPRR